MHAIAVVVLRGTIQAHANQKVVLVQESGPVIVQQQRIGLQAVAHRLPGIAIALL